MNSRRGGSPIPLVVAGILCLAVVIGAALEGTFSFATVPTTNPPPVPPKGLPGPSAPTPGPTGQHPKSVPPIDLWPVILVIGGIMLLAVALLLWFLLRGRSFKRRARRRDQQTLETDGDDLAVDVPEQPDVPTIRRGLDLAANILETERIPRDAIVKAWVGLQEAAEDSGVARRASETPTEFTSRIFGAGLADPDATDELLKLYLTARFGRREPSSADVARAREAVARLRAGWPDPVAALSLDASRGRENS